MIVPITEFSPSALGRAGLPESNNSNRTTDGALMLMDAPRELPTILWNLSNAEERRQMLESGGVVGSSGGAILMQANSVATDSASIDLAALMRAAVQGVGPYAAIIARAGVLSLPLMLSGDTPQPQAQDIKFGDLTLRLTAPRHGEEIGAAGTRAEFLVDKPGWFHFGSGNRKLDVPVTVNNGQLQFDLGALEAAYGKQIPTGILQMAARPAGVPTALQTTASGITTAMAGAPDPCGNLPGQRHHILPAEIMSANQQFLTRIGFKLDQPANMMKLPANQSQRNNMAEMCGENRPIHSGRHPREYGNAVSEQLRAIEGRGLGASESRELVNRLMSAIRTELSSGGYSSVSDPRLANFIRAIRL
jgi:hypothetical protein